MERTTVDTKCNSFVLIFLFVHSAEFDERLSKLPFELRELLFWVRIFPNLPWPELVIVMAGKASELIQQRSEYIILDSSDAVLSWMATERAQQVTGVSLDMQSYGKKNLRAAEDIIRLFREKTQQNHS